MTRNEQVAVNDIHKMLGELAAGQKARGDQMDRIEVKVDRLTGEHARTREMVVQHRTGWQLLVWIGGVTIAIIGAMKGLSLGGHK